VRHSPTSVADAACARLAARRRAFGTLPSGIDAAAIVERALAA
jgi:putative acyl-CoA dehydrogenase